MAVLLQVLPDSSLLGSPKQDSTAYKRGWFISLGNGTADIFRGFMVNSYVKRKENHVQAYAPNGVMVLK